MYLRLNRSTSPGLKFQKPKHCNLLDPMTSNFKASLFCGILDKCPRRAKPIRLIGNPDNQHPDKWSSAVFLKTLVKNILLYCDAVFYCNKTTIYFMIISTCCTV